MRFSIDVGSELELKLYQAVLLYKNEHGNRYMASVHGVVQQDGDGSPVLSAGQLLSTASLRELARQLGTGCPVEFLLDQVVARTPEVLAWWTPAAVRPMFFRPGSELEGVSGKRFPHPALLFVVRTAFCTSARFRRTGGRAQTANWPQRPTGISMATTPFVRVRCAPRSH
jgi:PRTRC genetic system protein B